MQFAKHGIRDERILQSPATWWPTHRVDARALWGRRRGATASPEGDWIDPALAPRVIAAD
jgi:hypothetical protein